MDKSNADFYFKAYEKEKAEKEKIKTENETLFKVIAVLLKVLRDGV
jgi:hypothetical protein